MTSMALKLFYITNDPEVARIAENNTVDRIWIDLESYGKEKRQKGMNTVKSNHTMEDVSVIRETLSGKSELMVRVNPLHDGSKKEIDEVIDRGADVVMLPFFETYEEASRFVDYVNGRAKTNLLVETVLAEKSLAQIIKSGMDEIHIGLNDLHLQHKKSFMFELLTDGTVEKMAEVLRDNNVHFGFGGIAKLDEGLLPARHVIAEHYRLGSSAAILSRSFYDSWIENDYEEVNRVFKYGLGEIRDYEYRLSKESESFFEKNRVKVSEEVSQIVKRINCK